MFQKTQDEHASNSSIQVNCRQSDGAVVGLVKQKRDGKQASALSCYVGSDKQCDKTSPDVLAADDDGSNIVIALNPMRARPAFDRFWSYLCGI